MTVGLLLATLAIVSPRDGAVVPLLTAGQKSYLEGDRPERFLRLGNPADRAKFAAMGARQVPLRLCWSGGRGAACELTISAEGGKTEWFAVTNVNQVHVTNLELGRVYKWAVRDVLGQETATAEFGTENSPPRFLLADGLSNFRDVGGWTTFEDKRVRSGRIFRSAALRAKSSKKGFFLRRKVEAGVRRITGAGLDTLRNDFGVRSDVDLRDAQDVEGLSASELGPDVRWCAVPFPAYEKALGREAREGFLKVMRILLQPESYPVLLHCSDGCGRTGTLVFLLNGLLGVQEEDLCRDLESSVFGGADLTPDQVKALLAALRTLGGETMNDCIEAYARRCGISSAEIKAFRLLMLE